MGGLAARLLALIPAANAAVVASRFLGARSGSYGPAFIDTD